MKFNRNLGIILISSLVGFGCVQTAPEDSGSSDVSPRSTSSSGSKKNFKMDGPNGTLNLIATKSVDLKSVAAAQESYSRVSVNSNGYSISMSAGEFRDRNFQVNVPLPRDGEFVSVSFFDENNNNVREINL